MDNAQWTWSFPGFLDQYLPHPQVPTGGGARGSGVGKLPLIYTKEMNVPVYSKRLPRNTKPSLKNGGRQIRIRGAWVSQTT